MEAYEPVNETQTVKRTPKPIEDGKQTQSQEEIIDRLSKLVKGEDVKEV